MFTVVIFSMTSPYNNGIVGSTYILYNAWDTSVYIFKLELFLDITKTSSRQVQAVTMNNCYKTIFKVYHFQGIVAKL